MTYTEKNTIVSMLTGMVVFGIYSSKMYQLYLDGRFEAADAGVLMGKSVLYMMAASIVVTIIMSIVFAIVHAIITRDENPSFVVDERDKQISLRGMQFSFIVFSIGFVGAAVGLVYAMEPIMAIFLIVTSMFVSSITGDVFKLINYRRG